eukprot:gene5178-851_t
MCCMWDGRERCCMWDGQGRCCVWDDSQTSRRPFPTELPLHVGGDTHRHTARRGAISENVWGQTRP